jgi:hypothetical protein
MLAGLRVATAFPAAEMLVGLKEAIALPAAGMLTGLKLAPVFRAAEMLSGLKVATAFPSAEMLAGLRVATAFPAWGTLRVESESAPSVPGLEESPAGADTTQLRLLRILHALDHRSAPFRDAAYFLRNGIRLMREGTDERLISIGIHAVVGAVEETFRQIWTTPRTTLHSVRVEMSRQGQLSPDVNRRMEKIYAIRNQSAGIGHGAGPTQIDVATVVVTNSIYCLEWLLFEYS